MITTDDYRALQKTLDALEAEVYRMWNHQRNKIGVFAHSKTIETLRDYMRVKFSYRSDDDIPKNVDLTFMHRPVVADDSLPIWTAGQAGAFQIHLIASAEDAEKLMAAPDDGFVPVPKFIHDLPSRFGRNLQYMQRRAMLKKKRVQYDRRFRIKKPIV